MTCSLIIPSRNSQATLPRTLESVRAATAGLAVETLVIDDAEGRGPSWARNRGLDRATGEVVFFCDADDTVRPGFFSAPLAALERTGADICLFSGTGEIVRSPRFCATPEDVRETYLPAFFGYSNDDVRRWNAGGRLDARKEPGSACLAAFRRDFLERHALRFDERMTFYEDAAFLASCVAFARSVVAIPDVLYDYLPRPDGNLATGASSRRHWEYKFLALDFRDRLDARCGGALGRFCEASCVLSALDLLRLGLKAHVPPRAFAAGLRRYLAHPRVAAALRTFPCSLRHPLVGALVALLRVASSNNKGQPT